MGLTRDVNGRLGEPTYVHEPLYIKYLYQNVSLTFYSYFYSLRLQITYLLFTSRDLQIRALYK